MRVAVIGSRTLNMDNIGKYLPEETSSIISGGAKGVDAVVRSYAQQNHIPLVEYLPEYSLYGRAAPLKRNISIITNADIFLAFWDGKSKGTAFVIRKCQELGIPCRVVLVEHPCKDE